VVLALVVTVAISLFAPHGSTQSVAAFTADTGRGAASTAEPTRRSGTGVLYVHVLGAVTRAGLYQLRPGARVVDAVAAAGGFGAEADQGGVNLARLLVDGEQLIVPTIGQAPVVDAPDASGQVDGGGGTVASASAKVNLNTATETELETLPRVGPAMAARILQWRKDNGRFGSVDDLMNITGIGDKTFDALKDLVTV
jgi:competence protein ComEA